MAPLLSLLLLLLLFSLSTATIPNPTTTNPDPTTTIPSNSNPNPTTIPIPNPTTTIPIPNPTTTIPTPSPSPSPSPSSFPLPPPSLSPLPQPSLLSPLLSPSPSPPLLPSSPLPSPSLSPLPQPALSPLLTPPLPPLLTHPLPPSTSLPPPLLSRWLPPLPSPSLSPLPQPSLPPLPPPSLSPLPQPSLSPLPSLPPPPLPSPLPSQSLPPLPSPSSSPLPSQLPLPSLSPLPSPTSLPSSSPVQSPSLVTAQSHLPSPTTMPSLTPTPSLPPAPPLSTEHLNQIQKACRATRFPQLCESSLSQHLPPNPNPLQILQAAISVSTKNLKTAQSMVKSILDSAVKNPKHTLVAKNCLEILNNSDYRIASANKSLPNGKIKDARAWTSAALSYQYGCRSGLKTVNDSKLITETAMFMDSVVDLTSNALSMMMSYDIFGNETGSWAPPMTERDGFWKGAGYASAGSGSGFKSGLPKRMEAKVKVCKVMCDYRRVQDAVDAAPDNGTEKYVIHIEEGIYEETVRVPIWKKHLVFLGDGMGKTVITGHLNVNQHNVSTYNTATVGVLGDGFMACNLTIENTAGMHNPNVSQAVALRLDSDKAFIENCEFLGHQDTLYAHTLRQFYKSCHIHGTIDFIFGTSAAVFQDCKIVIEPRVFEPEKGETNVVSAHGRTDPAQSTGLVFHNCSVHGSENYLASYKKNPSVHQNYLGRPWKEFSRTVFINCTLDSIVSPQGWMPWDADFALSTLYFGEFGNSGRGADVSKRVPWSSRVPAEHVHAYSVKNFIQGDEWIPKSS